jgi:predicted RNA-binding protein with PIN domain
MAVPVVVDGYNLLHARGAAPSAETRQALLRDLRRWATARGRPVVLVFDAWAGGERAAREERHGPVTVVYTRAGERADAHIVRWVETHREAVVVTSDRAVQQGARRRGAAVVDAARFAARLDAPEAAPGSGDPAPGADAPPARRPGAPGGARGRWIQGL